MIKIYKYVLAICLLFSSVGFAQVTIDFNHSEASIPPGYYSASGITSITNGYWYNNHLSVDVAGNPLIITFDYAQPYVKLTLVVANHPNETLSAWTGTAGTGSQVGSTTTLSSLTEYVINGTGSNIRSIKIDHNGEVLYNEYNLLKYASVLPVELTSFSATIANNSAALNWATATEVNNYGFEVERRVINSWQLADSNWQKIGFVRGAGTSNAPKKYSYSDLNLSSGKYIYRLKQIDNDGSFKYYQSAEIEVGVAPKELTLSSNYPNPFNPTTTMEFTVPQDGRASLKIYNTVGQLIATLFDEDVKAGYVQKAVFDASKYSSGVFFSRLQYMGKSITKKIILMK